MKSFRRSHRAHSDSSVSQVKDFKMTICRQILRIRDTRLLSRAKTKLPSLACCTTRRLMYSFLMMKETTIAILKHQPCGLNTQKWYNATSWARKASYLNKSRNGRVKIVSSCPRTRSTMKSWLSSITRAGSSNSAMAFQRSTTWT